MISPPAADSLSQTLLWWGKINPVAAWCQLSQCCTRMGSSVVLVAVCALLTFLGGCAHTSSSPSRVNKFGDRTEDLVKLGLEVSDALRDAVPSDGRVGSAAARARLDRLLEPLRLPQHLHIFRAEPRTSRICRMCAVIGTAVIDIIRSHNATGDHLAELAFELCVRANVIAEHICWGMVESNTPIVEYILRNSPQLDGAFACGTILPDCSDGAPAMTWSLEKEMGAKPWGRIRNTMMRPHEAVAPYRILQITDYHWDSEYVPGGNANCGEPTCCRKSQGEAATPADRAGRWGDYRSCDVPWDTVAEFLQHAQEERLADTDLIYFTGDIVDHGVWETSREKNEFRIRFTFDVMKQAFGNVTVLPLVGNHEPHPLNVFAPDYITEDALSTQWLYGILADSWISLWLPEDTRETIMRGGYYTVLVKPGFRVVALNTMYCYPLNWWLLHDPVDPTGQLAWLVDVLLAAEEAEEKVHILSHIPPGSDDCLESWSREFARIVDRFSATIAAHFNGHTHTDDFCIFYDKSGRPNNVAFNGGSLTTYEDVNPNYKIYLVDGNHKRATWNVLDTELWGFNLTKANLQPNERPEWYRMYSFRETFDVQSLHPYHLNLFIERLAQDNQLQQMYYWYHMLDSDISHSTGCDAICAERLICSSVTTVINDNEQCQKILNKTQSLFP